MFTNQSTDVSLGVPCRTVDAIRTPEGDTSHHLWLAGTCDRLAPSLQVLQWHPDINQVVLGAAYEMPAPVKRIACGPDAAVPHVLVASEQQSSVILYQLPWSDAAPGSTIQTLATLAPEASFGTPTVDMAWSPDDGPQQQVVTVDRLGHAVLWDLTTQQQQEQPSRLALDATGGPEPRVVWDPHSSPFCLARTIPTSRSNGVLLWDTRSAADATTVLTGSAQQGILDLDYNPNRPHVLATAGRNGTAQFWDLRHPAHPLATARGGHSHFAATVQYNPFHDQLVLTTGTDRVTNLWRMSSCSSAPLLMHGSDGVGSLLPDGGDEADEEEPTRSSSTEDRTVNARVQRYAEFGDSVYAAAWGATDAWVYLAISYDGKAVLQHVPSKEKYKILL